MGMIENMDQGQKKKFEKLAETLKKQNPAIEYETFAMDDKKAFLERKLGGIEKEIGKEEKASQFDVIMDRLTSIERKIDMIFGGHVLIDGQFRKIRP